MRPTRVLKRGDSNPLTPCSMRRNRPLDGRASISLLESHKCPLLCLHVPWFSSPPPPLLYRLLILFPVPLSVCDTFDTTYTRYLPLRYIWSAWISRSIRTTPSASTMLQNPAKICLRISDMRPHVLYDTLLPRGADGGRRSSHRPLFFG